MKFGVIGWGLRKQLPKLAHRPDRGWSLAALADPSDSARADFVEFAGGDTYSDFRSLFDLGLDAVFVDSPDWLHEEHTVPLLEAGIPVYLEKPMAITVESCDRILAAAERTGTKLYLGHNMRHFPVVNALRDLIADGAIGNIQTAWCRHFVSYGGEAYYRDWHADRRQSTGLLLQKGAHDIDVLHWLCGGYAKRVTAMGKLAVYGDQEDRLPEGANHPIAFERTWPPRSLKPVYHTVDVEDVNLMLMELDNGVLASYQQCQFTPDAWRNYTIIGDAGRIENFGDGPGAIVKLWNRNHHAYAPDGDLEIVIPEAEGPHAGADHRIIEEFVGYLDGSRTPSTSPWDARMAVAAGYAATESVRNGSVPVDVA